MGKRVWKREWDAVLREKNAAGWSNRQIAAFLGVSRSLVDYQRIRLGLPVCGRFAAFDEFRRLNAEGKTLHETAAALGINYSNACRIREKLGLPLHSSRRFDTFSPANVAAIREAVAAAPLMANGRRQIRGLVDPLAARLGLTRNQVLRVMKGLRLNPLPRWTPEAEQGFLDGYRRGWSDPEIAAEIGFTAEMVSRHRRNLGLPPSCRGGIGGAPADAPVSPWHRRAMEFAASYNLPADLSTTQVRIVLLLATGPKTKRELVAGLGLKWDGRDRGCHNLRNSRGSLLMALAKRGLVLPLRRYTATQLPTLYALTARTLHLLASAHPPGETA